MASKKASKSGTNLSQFVRDRPNMSVADIIAEGKKQGLTIKAGLVYNVRSTSKAKGGGVAKRSGRGVKVDAALGALTGLEEAIRRICKEEILKVLRSLH